MRDSHEFAAVFALGGALRCSRGKIHSMREKKKAEIAAGEGKTVRHFARGPRKFRSALARLLSAFPLERIRILGAGETRRGH